MTHPEAPVKPTVLIIGAGIGGLMMGYLLEQINVPYHIFERAAEVKPLGSALSFGPNIMPALEQLGLYEELLKIGKEFDYIFFYSNDCKQIGTLDISISMSMMGYRSMIFARPRFYEILRKRVPAEKISFRKKIVKTEDSEGKVTIYCADETSYTGDILIGADGAYSGVRQSMYRSMEEKNILPEADKEGFSIGYNVYVGVAKPENPEKYPELKKDFGKFSQVLFDGDSNCYIMTLPDNQISWGLGTQLPETIVKSIQDRNVEWSAEDSESVLNKYRDYPSPIGGTMGEIFDATPRKLVSKVNLEEKLFETWHHGRSVLIGDACHKFHPAGGQGAVNAMYDAIVLANCIYAMKDTTSTSVKAAFDEYYKARYSWAKVSFENSTGLSKILNGQRFYEKLIRTIALNYIPTWLFNAILAKSAGYRPQVAWLPLTEVRGSSKAFPQHFETKGRPAVSYKN